MSDSITCLNSLFNVPKDTLGDFIIRNIRADFDGSRPICEGEVWEYIRASLVEWGYCPGPSKNIFRNSRSKKIKSHVDYSRWRDGIESQVAHAMSTAQSILWEDGPLASHGMGRLPLHFILTVIDSVETAFSPKTTPEGIICLADDFAILGRRAGELIKSGGRL